VQLEIVIQPNGAIGNVAVVQSSSHRVLDDAALETVKNLSPLPFPPDVPPRRLRARLPVVFELR
jgi:TonB family protein